MEPRRNPNNLFGAANFLLYDSDSDDNNSNYDGNGNSTTSTVWVFGYGSLCWNPGFEYSKCVTGYIRGYVRRFWQGNTAHRGTKERVCLLCYFNEFNFNLIML